METNKIKLNTVIISITVIVIVEITTRLLITHNHLAHLTGLGLARLAEIILLLMIVKVWQQHLSTIGLASSKIYYGIKKGLVWAVAFGVAAGIVLLIIHLVGINLSGLFQMRLPSESSRLVTFITR